MQNTLIIIPTYNEVENLHIVDRIFTLYPDIQILIVDDSSTDGSLELISELQKKYSNLNLLKRAKKLGLASAYMEGFSWAKDRGIETIITMDCDFSHPPEIVQELNSQRKNFLYISGSRYMQGGSTKNWPKYRLFLSKLARTASSSLIGIKLSDPTSGLNCIAISVINKLNLQSFISHGFSFQVELKYKAIKQGIEIKEIPFSFQDRKDGKSKMSLGIILEGLLTLLRLRFFRG